VELKSLITIDLTPKVPAVCLQHQITQDGIPSYASI
jgi:hypothetical protein